MNVVSIVLLVALGGLVIWLVIDTVIYLVKKTKQRKQEKDQASKKLDDSRKN